MNNKFGGTVTEFVEAQLALHEQRTGEPLTNAERAKLSGQYEQMYDAYATGNGFKEIAEIIASVPSKCVEWGLRYSGATSKGTARAVGNMTNDVRAALGGAAAVKGILKSGIKAAKNVASKSIPIKKAIHIGKGSGLKPKIPVNSNNPLPANLNRMSVPQTLIGVSEVNGIQQLAQQIGGKPGAGLKTNLTPTMNSAPKPAVPATNVGNALGQNQTRKLVEATIGVNAKPIGGVIPNKPVMLLETAEKASAAAKKVRDAQAAAAQNAGLPSAEITKHASNINKTTREQRWVHVLKTKGKGVSKVYGLELAHKPKKSFIQGHDYSEALPKTIADHRGLEHRFLKERKTGTVISKPKTALSNNSLSLPKEGKLPD